MRTRSYYLRRAQCLEWLGDQAGMSKTYWGMGMRLPGKAAARPAAPEPAAALS